MKRPQLWLRWLFLTCLLLVVAESAVLRWMAPSVVIRKLEQATAGQVAVERAHLFFPLNARLTGLRFTRNIPEAGFSVQRATIRPRWLSVLTKTLEVGILEIERPLLRLTRAKSGTLFWPALAASDGINPAAALPPSWRMRVHSIKVIDGALEFVDDTPPTPFHALLNHVSVVMGPVTVPFDGSQISFALRAAVTGRSGELAPLYCSGWWEASAGTLQASCQLEPLALVVFEPYFQRSPVIRVYGATLSSTSQWSAKANALEASIQLELGNLREGDLSVHGRTIVDIKQLAQTTASRLTGAVSLTGPLNEPGRWHGEFVAGDDGTQRLVEELLERNIKIVTVALGRQPIGIHIGPVGGTPQDVEAVSKEIREALEILATPVVPEVAPVPLSEEVVPEAPAAPPEQPDQPPTAPIPL